MTPRPGLHPVLPHVPEGAPRKAPIPKYPVLPGPPPHLTPNPSLAPDLCEPGFWVAEHLGMPTLSSQPCSYTCSSSFLKEDVPDKLPSVLATLLSLLTLGRQVQSPGFTADDLKQLV